MRTGNRLTLPAAVKKVLIVGGGIGGMTLAIALQRAGIEAHVIELHDKTVGVGIVCTGNTMRALKALDLLDRCLEQGFASDVFRVYDAAGNFIMDNPMPTGAGPEYPGCIALERPELAHILRTQALVEGATVRIGLTVQALTDSPPGVLASLSDGMSAVYDLVVGADGFYSRVRQLIFGDRYQPQFTGQSGWRWLTERHEEIATTTFFHGLRKVGLVPLSQKTMYVLITDTMPGKQRVPVEDIPRMFRERLEEFGAPIIADLRGKIDASSVLVYRPYEVLLVPPPWHSSRVVLIGDAAHTMTPHLGNGGGMAIEDAIVLAELLRDGQSIEDVLSRFVQRRYERCRMVYENSLQICKWEMHGGTDDLGYGLSRQTWAELLKPP